jgi:predicted cupin superfamily sugar epimerase
MEASQIIEALNMKPHPEGGYYAETYRHPQTVDLINGRVRNLSTTIYFLLTGSNKSHFHRLSSDETWFFHHGENIELIMLQDGKSISYTIGNNLTVGALPQLLIPANTWFAAHLPSKNGYALVSCTVSPGFDFEDFELASLHILKEEGFIPENIPTEFVIGNK